MCNQMNNLSSLFGLIAETFHLSNICVSFFVDKMWEYLVLTVDDSVPLDPFSFSATLTATARQRAPNLRSSSRTPASRVQFETKSIRRQISSMYFVNQKFIVQPIQFEFGTKYEKKTYIVSISNYRIDNPKTNQGTSNLFIE